MPSRQDTTELRIVWRRLVSACGAGIAALSTAATLTGCGNAAGNASLGAVAITAVGGYSPAQEIEQVYYLGIFDPHEQVQPQQVYRVTVHGQASFISQMKFGSGWVPAKFIDSLSSSAGISPDNGLPTVQTGDKEQLATLKTGRRMVLFGPEGFREAPADFRLVVVMGASPEAFFKAIDSSIGVISQVRQEQNNPQVLRQLLQARSQLSAEQQRLSDLNADVTSDIPAATKGG
jgi:hypothetical protein